MSSSTESREPNDVRLADVGVITVLRAMGWYRSRAKRRSATQKQK